MRTWALTPSVARLPPAGPSPLLPTALTGAVGPSPVHAPFFFVWRAHERYLLFRGLGLPLRVLGL